MTDIGPILQILWICAKISGIDNDLQYNIRAGIDFTILKSIFLKPEVVFTWTRENISTVHLNFFVVIKLDTKYSGERRQLKAAIFIRRFTPNKHIFVNISQEVESSVIDQISSVN